MHQLARLISLSFQFIFVLVIGSLVGIWLAGKYGYIQPIKPYVVLSGSMEPAIQTGAVAVVSPKAFGYSIGDIITYSLGNATTITHRVTSLKEENGQVVYQTKGDANENADPSVVPKSAVVGSVIFSVPYIGYAVDFAKKPQGFILLVIVPATIIVYEELRFLKRETARQLSRLRKSSSSKPNATTQSPPVVQTSPTQQVQPSQSNYSNRAPLPPHGHPFEHLFHILPPVSFTVKQNHPTPTQVPQHANVVPARIVTASYSTGGLNRRLLIIPAIAVTTIFAGVTGSYFIDHEISQANILMAAISFVSPSISPTPTPTSVPELVESLTVDSSQPNGAISSVSLVQGDQYYINISGTWTNRNGTDTVDADYTSYDAFATPGLDGDPSWTSFGLTDYWNLLDVQIDQSFVNWGAYTPTHEYIYSYTGTGSPVNFRVFDGIPETNTLNPGWYSDNAGLLTITIYHLP